MNVASLELCKELYELSGWWGTHRVFWDINGDVLHSCTDQGIGYVCPAFDLGYLLRKLPKSLIDILEDGPDINRTDDHEWPLQLHFIGKDRCAIQYVQDCGIPNAEWFNDELPEDSPALEGIADTPEDAACKLCIVLFRQGILKRD